MPGYLLVRANNLYSSYVEGQTPSLVEAKGAVVEVRHVDDGYGAAEVPPNFVRIKLSDGFLSDLEQYGGRWERNVDWQVVSHDTVLDVFELRIFSTNPGLSNVGAITLNEVSSIVLDWNGTIISNTTNEVVFDIGIFNAIKSFAFWQLAAVNAVTFNEISYDQATGTHRISADYSLTGARPKNVDELVRQKGATIVSHSGKIITFDITTSVVTAQIKTYFKDKLKKVVLRRRFSIPIANVDTAIAAGGEITVTLAQLQANIIDESV